MSNVRHEFPDKTVLGVAYSMLIMTSSVLAVRIAVNIKIPKPLNTSDHLLFLSFACFATMCSLYISMVPRMKRIYGVSLGEHPPYAGMKDDSAIIYRLIFGSFCLFWMTLWCIKFSLLFLYRKLLAGLSRTYTFVWWALFGLCVITHFGNYGMYFRSCGSFAGFFDGGCLGEGPKRHQLVSLYYSFAADTVTNLLIMALPISLTWNLQIGRTRKLAILLLFASGFVCIIFACIRVAQIAIIASREEAKGQPLDPTWLAIWGMVECAIAVIIGCAPAFAVLINASRNKTTYSSRGYHRQASDSEKMGATRVEFETISTMRNTSRWRPQSRAETEINWAHGNSSQEELRKGDGIMVSTTLTQETSPISNDVRVAPSRRSTVRSEGSFVTEKKSLA